MYNRNNNNHQCIHAHCVTLQHYMLGIANNVDGCCYTSRAMRRAHISIIAKIMFCMENAENDPDSPSDQFVKGVTPPPPIRHTLL